MTSNPDVRRENTDLYDSGVTNGDVDWLFRGKSKKLTKKMNLNKEEKKVKESSPDLKDGKFQENSDEKLNLTEKLPETPEIPEKTAGKLPKSPQQPPKLSIKGEVASKESQTSKELKPEPKKESKTEETKETESSNSEERGKLDKLFRSRSSSFTKDKKTEKKEKPRDKKFNLINYSSSGFDGASIYNQSFEHNYLDQSAAGSAAFGGNLSTPSISKPPQLKPRPRSSSTSLNSSVNSKEKKSLFSSLSSKFKGSTSGSIDPLQVEEKPKLNPNALGSSANPKEEINVPYTKPPAELGGIPIKRRPSVQGSESDKLSSSANSFNSFFKRRSSTSSQTSTCVGNQRVVLNKNPNKEKNLIKELEDVDLKRVNFAIDKLIYDPQQQIPSRRPKKGNVLIPEDLTAPPPRLSQGISLNDGSNGKQTEQVKYSEKELSLAIEAQKRALIEADKHAQEAHLSAKRIAHEVNQYKLKLKSNQKINENSEVDTFSDDFEEDTITNDQDNKDAKAIEIDKPLHLHEKYFDDDTMQQNISDLTLEQIYTRCCHLREILPIPATLKQLKNKSKPLSVLKLLNPKPTLIDVLSFSDFIAIVPITTVIFDNVTMTTEMFKHILSALSYNKSLEKLSLRNVPIDEVGWKYLCKFLSRNHSVKKLDISQQRIKSDLKSCLVRSSMNWKLFIKSLVTRGGMEELVINGCKLKDEVFKELIEKAVGTTTYRLGIASCELNCFKTNVVCDWLKSPGTKCVGVDVAFNDLSQGQLKFFTECFNSGNVKLIFFSLYQTNLSDVEETGELLKSLIKVETLRFLDLSSLPSLFPSIISKLNVYLPRFENLKRIHFDLNELTSPAIIAISEILPKIKGLIHVSLLGNRNLNNSVAASIYTSIKKSTSIYTLDLDYDLIDDKLNQKIAFYLMRNMDHVINLNGSPGTNSPNDQHKPKDQEEEELMFDGSLLMETAERLLAEKEKSSDKTEDIKLNNMISNALIEKTRELRQGVHKTIDTLFSKRNSGTLSLEGKESLLRFCLLDASLEKLVHLFEEQAVSMSQSSSLENLEQIDSSAPKESFGNKRETHPILDLNAKELLHQSSTELITSGPILSPRNTETLNKLGYFQQSGESSTFEPHQVVVESDSKGQTIPIDYLTGRPVLMRSISQTSSHAKEQELEEGELHRFGFFMQQRNNSNNDLAKKEVEEKKKEAATLPTLNVLPSGNELREAIMKAKGIESITDLIDKINNDRFNIEKLYSVTDKSQHAEIEKQVENLKLNQKEIVSNDDLESIDSMVNDGDQVDAVVDEVYDKLLNDAERVRSNK